MRKLFILLFLVLILNYLFLNISNVEASNYKTSNTTQLIKFKNSTNLFNVKIVSSNPSNNSINQDINLNTIILNTEEVVEKTWIPNVSVYVTPKSWKQYLKESTTTWAWNIIKTVIDWNFKSWDIVVVKVWNQDSCDINDWEVCPKTTQDINFTIEDIRTETIARLKLPLVKSDYYYWKYINAEVWARNFTNKTGLIIPWQKVSLLKSWIINFNKNEWFVNTKYWFAYWVCWFVTDLWWIIDRANATFKAKYWFDLFIVNESYLHSSYYPTYKKVRNWKGYAIWTSWKKNYDYIFTVNPKAKWIIKWVKFKIWWSTKSSWYNRQSIEGKLYVIYYNK